MKNCPNNHSNPDNAQFCRICGHRFEDTPSLPFHMVHPELHLRPISDFEDLHFWFNKPEYVEDPNESINPEYLYIARNRKVGILYWKIIKRWYGKEHEYNRIIPCEYDKIEKTADAFICYKGNKRYYMDSKGNILK